jgi:hypothetical protein
MGLSQRHLLFSTPGMDNMRVMISVVEILSTSWPWFQRTVTARFIKTGYLPDTRIFANFYRRHCSDHPMYRTAALFVLLPYHINITLVYNKIGCYYGVQIKQNGMCWVCISYGRIGKLIQHLIAKLEWKKKTFWEKQLDSSVFGWDPFQGSSEYGKEILRSVKRWCILLSVCTQLLAYHE